MRARLARGLFGLTLLVSVVHVLLLASSERSMFHTDVISDGFPLVTLGAIAGAGVGAVIVSRYPGHVIGWLLVVGQLVSELGLMLRAYGHNVLAGELGSAPGGEVANWLSLQAGGLFVVALLTILFLLAPDGQPTSRWSRRAVALPLLGLAINTLAICTVPPSRLDADAQLEGHPGRLLEVALVAAFLLVSAGAVAAAVLLFRRLRRATGDERAQLRWVAVAAIVLAFGVVVNVGLAALPTSVWFQPLPVMVGYLSIPFFLGIAILRYRLYEIDVFLNRAIVMGVLTGIVTVGYVGLVVAIGRVFPMTDGKVWPSILATALVAVAAQPLRARVGRMAGRIVYGARAAPYLELASFSSRLQEAPSTQELLRRVSEAVGDAVGARSTTIRAEVPGGPASLVTWPEHVTGASGPASTLQVIEQGERLGELTVTMPPGRSLRADDQRLLADFAVQLGRAFRNISLESALAQRLKDLRASMEDLEASSRRLDLAQELERQRFESDLAENVVPHLRVVEGQVREILAAGPPDATTRHRLDGLHREVQVALEALRTLTRGVFPAQLARLGLSAALTGLLSRTGMGTLVGDLQPGRRFEPAIESAAYFCVAEVLRVVGSGIEVRIEEGEQRLSLTIRASTPAPEPQRLLHLSDRAAALSGQLTLPREGGQTVVSLDLPVTLPVPTP